MVKTTVYMDEDTAQRLRWMSASTGRPQAELIREALGKYTADAKRPFPKGAGMFDSGYTDTFQNYREILKQAAREGRWK
jgi:hypothetical protein